MSTDTDLDDPTERRSRHGPPLRGVAASPSRSAPAPRAASRSPTWRARSATAASSTGCSFVVLGAIGVVNLAALLDARTPLLVADDLGVRLRLGRTWVGLPWGGLHEVEHRPQRGWWRDGLLVVRPHYVQRVIEDLDPAARRTARLNRRLHGAPLAVPLGLATRALGEPDLTAALRRPGRRPDPGRRVARSRRARRAGARRRRRPPSRRIADVSRPRRRDPRAGRGRAVAATPGVERRPGRPDDRRGPRRLRDPRPAIALLIGTHRGPLRPPGARRRGAARGARDHRQRRPPTRSARPPSRPGPRSATRPAPSRAEARSRRTRRSGASSTPSPRPRWRRS